MTKGNGTRAEIELTVPARHQTGRYGITAILAMFTITALALFFLAPSSSASPSFNIFAVNDTQSSLNSTNSNGTSVNGTSYNSTIPPVPLPVPISETANSSYPIPTNITSPPPAATSAGQSWNYSSPFYDYPLNASLPDNNVYISPQWQEAHERARSELVGWTLDEKVDLTTGVQWMRGRCVGNIPAIPGQDFPGLCLQDSPTGVRFADFVSVFPAGINVAST
jgi:hypothetical protein